MSRWNEWQKLAMTLLKSNFLPPAYKTPEQVIAVLIKGKELGVPSWEALSSIHIIAGKPTVSPQLMLALVRRSGELEDIQIEKLEKSVKITVKRKGQSPITTEFGVTEATMMQLINKDNYKKQPFTMFQWRAMSANFRITFPDVISGLYMSEELDPDLETMEETDAQVELSDSERYDILARSLDSATDLNSLAELEDWVRDNKAELDKLPERLKDSLARQYVVYQKKLEAKNGTDKPTQPDATVTDGDKGSSGESDGKDSPKSEG